MKKSMKVSLIAAGCIAGLLLGVYVFNALKTEWQSIKQEIRAEYKQTKSEVVRAQKAQAAGGFVKDIAGGRSGGLPSAFGQ